jgi:hypothetical protein
MTLIELKNRIDLILQNKRNEELIVCIPNNKLGIYDETRKNTFEW